MDENQRLKLQQMISENKVIDQTELIRNLKHSDMLFSDINNLLCLKKKYNNDTTCESFTCETMSECNFLFTYYTDVYNKVKNDEIDLDLLFKFINILKTIENGEKEQHEASYEVGNILKEIYIDSALKKAEKIDSLNSDENKYRGPEVSISWKQFKETKNGETKKNVKPSKNKR